MENNIENQQLNKLVDNYVELKHAVKDLFDVIESSSKKMEGSDKIIIDVIIKSELYSNVKKLI